MTTISPANGNSSDSAPLPHPLTNAALDYAKNGIPIVVFDTTLGNHKECGNLVGNADDPDDKWYDHATTDPAVIREWLRDFGPQATGIATSPGKADAVVLDVDKPELVPPLWWFPLSSGPFQSTDANDDRRGHYWYDLPPGKRFGNQSFPWGDIRCVGGGLILAPTPHARAVQGGRYEWIRQGETRPLPVNIASALRGTNRHANNGQRDTDHQGRGVVQSAANVDVEAFCDAHQGNDYPHGLPQVHKHFHRLVDTGEKNRHDAMKHVLPWSMCEAAADGYPAREVEKLFRATWLKVIAPDFPHHDEAEFDSLLRWAINQAETDDHDKRRLRMARNYGARHDAPLNNVAAGRLDNVLKFPQGSAGENREGSDCPAPILKFMNASQWAKPVGDPKFFVAKALCQDTFGVNAGPKKSLKTHDNQALGFSVATGINLYRNPLFPVLHTGTVLYIVGEGGEIPVRRTLHRMARAYGLKISDLANDPDFPLKCAFGAAPLDSKEFRDELRQGLDTCQPDLVLIESFYNFHPRDLEAGNLFARGQVIDTYHKFIRNECDGATSLITDHWRSTNTGKTLDLDNISMAGQAENADSWIMRNHHSAPDVEVGEFFMHTGFGSRQWGGTEWYVNWHLGPFDHDQGHHVGEISWDVNPAVGNGNGSGNTNASAGPLDRQKLILEYLKLNPDTTKNKAINVLYNRHGGEKKFRAAWDELTDAGKLVPVQIASGKTKADGSAVMVPGWREMPVIPGVGAGV
jgi:hypothetical protein